MRAEWRLAISNVSARRSRSLLLTCVVALAATLIGAVGTSIGSVRNAILARVNGFVGDSDVRILPRGSGALLDASILDVVRAWPDVERVGPRLEGSIALRFGKPVWLEGADGVFRRDAQTHQVTARSTGGTPDGGWGRAVEIIAGRMPSADDEIVLDSALVQTLAGNRRTSLLGQLGMNMLARGSGRITKADPGPEVVADQAAATDAESRSLPEAGDWVEFVRFGESPRRLTIVGIATQPPLGGSPWCYMTVNGLSAATGQHGKLSRVDVSLKNDSDADAFASRHGPDLPREAMLQTTERITSGLHRNLRANQLGFVLASTMAYLAASFIVMTGLSTGVTERLRELAILRCIGARGRQLAGAQILQGAILGVAGSAIGVPLGVAIASILLRVFHDSLQADLWIDPVRIGGAFTGAVLAGILASLWPAWRAMRSSPLDALAVRARPASTRTIAVISACGLAGVLTHLVILLTVRDGQTLFWTYVPLGVPGLMAGYFLLGVPAVILMSRVAARLLERPLGLPRGMLRRTIHGTPFRFGFTAGALMLGLALMVAIWTQGSAAMRDWFDKIRFPDAFAVGLNLRPEALEAARRIPFVTDTCAITLQPVEIEAFGVRSMMRFKTFFIGFEPEPFFRMTRVEWVQGDQETAVRRLNQGGAVIVSREYLVARGVGVGGTLTCEDAKGRKHDFEIVGVVTSPGLELVSNFFDVGEDFTEQRVHAVFGSRRDMIEHFANDSVGLIQMSLDPAVPDQEVHDRLSAELAPFGVLNVGSGRWIRNTIQGYVRSSLLIASTVAVFAMLLAGLGVANLIVAGIQARQFEFGVLRAIGGTRGLLARLVLAEAIVIALSACILGTLMGVQGAYGAARINAVLWGIEVTPIPPIGPIALGWCFLLIIAVGAATPAAIRLARREPRELLAASDR